MEDSISDATAQTAKAMAGEKMMARELDRNRKQAEEWQSRAATAVDAGDDDLARKALSRKREHENLATALEDQLETAREASVTLRRQLDGMKAKLAEAKRSLTTLSARKRSADFRKKMECQAAGLGAEADDSPFAKFDRLKARVEQSEAEADALAELRAAGKDRPVVEDEPVEEPTGVDAELAELKRKARRS
jgi:phage shock protein A